MAKSSAPPRMKQSARRSSVPSRNELNEEERLLNPKSVPTVLLVITGSIAAYKSVVIARRLRQQGVSVIPVLTKSALKFVGESLLSGICGEVSYVNMFDNVAGELHVDLTQAVNLIVVAPTTADFLARCAQGRADDLAAACILCAKSPVLFAPAMHPRMWSNIATQRNVDLLKLNPQVRFVGPVDGEVASGERGMGRMVEPETVVHVALSMLANRDLSNLRVIITAGPTVEDIDPVRFVSNRSTGKMGFALAERAAMRGASVTLISGPSQLATPLGVKRIDVRSALAMRSALWQALGPRLESADVLIMSAAVSDYRPSEQHAAKVKRSNSNMSLELAPNPDILAEIGAARMGSKPLLIGFAVETDTDDNMVQHARQKLEKKRVDMVVVNHAHDSLGKDDNRAMLVTSEQVIHCGVLSKDKLADEIMNRVMLMRGT